MDEKIIKIFERLAMTEQAILSQKTTIEQCFVRITGHEKRIETLESKAEFLEKSVADIKGQVGEIKAISSKIAENTSNSATLRDMQDAIKKIGIIATFLIAILSNAHEIILALKKLITG